MKKLLFFGLLGCLIIVTGKISRGQDQLPYGFNYQAIARNASGSAIVNTDMKVKIGILSDTTVNTLVWEEEHSVRTNGYGLFSLVVGGPKGTRTGGSAATFNVIDWSASQMFIYVQIKNPATATSYTPMGKAKLWSVPYALLSGKSKQLLSSPFLFNGDTVYLTRSFAIGSNKPMKAQLAVVGTDDASDDPLFEVRRKDGQPVFSVFSDAVNINVPYNGKKGSPSRGGFAVGGFDAAKGTYVSDLLRVTPDSIRMYTNNNPSAGKGSPSRGGFAVGGFDADKSTTGNFIDMTYDNYFIGHQSGQAITTGLYNTFFGYQAGYSNTTGSNNVFVGNRSGFRNTTGYDNVFLGTQAGYSNINGFENTFIGNQAGVSNTTGYFNIMIGDYAGVTNTEGTHNVFLGQYSGRNNTTGSFNVFVGQQTGEANTTGFANLFAGRAAGNFNTTGIANTFLGTNAGNANKTGQQNLMVGAEAGKWNDSGSYNVNVGFGAGFNNTNGSYNIMLGYYTGLNLTSGSGNIFIGYGAGGGMSNTSNKLFIENSGADANNALIYGDFDADLIRLNGNVEIRNKLYLTSGAQVIYVNGAEALYYEGGYFSWGFGGDWNYFDDNVNIGYLGNSSYKLVVNGNCYSFGGWYGSDMRLKNDIRNIENPLTKVMNLKGVSFEWRKDEFKDKGLPDGRHYGVIAQDIEKVLPEVVAPGPDGDKAVAYHEIIPVLIEAIKEQQTTIDDLKAQIKAMDDKIKKLESLIDH